MSKKISEDEAQKLANNLTYKMMSVLCEPNWAELKRLATNMDALCDKMIKEKKRR